MPKPFCNRVGRTALAVSILNQFKELLRCQDRAAPSQQREGGRGAACPYRIGEKGNWSQDQLDQRVPHDAKTHGLMGERAWTTDIWATCWPLLIFCEGNAAGTSLHHKVLYLQICVSLLLLLLLPPSTSCNCLTWASSLPNTHTRYQYNQTLYPSTEKKWRVFKITAVF